MVMAARRSARIVKLLDDEVVMPPPTPDCEREPTVGAYHDGELSEAAREAFEAHLATCPSCAAELERVRAVSRWMEPLRTPVLSAAEKDELATTAIHAVADDDEAQANRMRIEPGRTVRWARWVTAAAAAVFLFSVVQLFRAQHVTGRDPANGGTASVPAVQRSTTAPHVAPVEQPAGRRPPAQPDSQDPAGLQKD
jgi:anti-sigma factor RsiW